MIMVQHSVLSFDPVPDRSGSCQGLTFEFRTQSFSTSQPDFFPESDRQAISFITIPTNYGLSIINLTKVALLNNYSDNICLAHQANHTLSRPT